MASLARKQAICAQGDAPTVTGVDFVWVDPADHRRLLVFFVIDPDRLARPVDRAGAAFGATIAGLEDGDAIAIQSRRWFARGDDFGGERLALEIVAAREGDFQTHRLRLFDEIEAGAPSRLDPFSSAIDFSFKQSCPSPFDCKSEEDPLLEDERDYPIDYLARDFESFRRALLAFAEARYSHWDAKVPVDFGAMVQELFAALGDEFSYIQDRFQREGRLATLTQRRSFDALARLVDYRLDPGEAASGWVVLDVSRAGVVRSGLRLEARPEDRAPISFEVGESFEAIRSGDAAYAVDDLWNAIALYVPEGADPILGVGAREALMRRSDALEQSIRDHGDWVGRRVLIETRPMDPASRGERALVTIERTETLFDPLAGEAVIRIRWREEDALRAPLDIGAGAVARANLAPVRAGARVEKRFHVGRPPVRAGAMVEEPVDPDGGDAARAIERQGPLRDGARPTLHRFTLEATIKSGLGWRTEITASGRRIHHPEALARHVETSIDWEVVADPMRLTPAQEALTIEPGRYAVVQSGERRGTPYAHRDYVDDQGYSLRFGAGEFGRAPLEGAYDAVYRTGPGTDANLPADTTIVVHGAISSEIEAAGAPPLIRAARNPFAFTNGRDPEPLERARRIVSAAYKERVFRAVRDEDYKAQIERFPWAQRAHATTRWTGAWASTFVTADPKGAVAIDPSRARAMAARLDEVRQIGRRVIARQPTFQPIDLRIAIRLDAGAAFGAAAASVSRALSARGGFFDPDRFTFGAPLRRPALEAAIARAIGVRAVLAIEIRLRGLTDFRPFLTPEIAIPADKILKLENDPNRPGQGSIRVHDRTLPPREASL